jgi:hypothetical protein
MVKSAFVRLCVVGTMVIGLAVSLSANHSWGGYHWARTSNPLALKLGNNLTGGWPSYLGTTATDWDQNDPYNTLNLSIVAGTSNRNCRPKSGRVEVCNAAYGFNGWLGIAQIWITDSVHITQATTRLNDSYFKSAPYNTSAWRNLVMCQEVGHTFGLDHQDETFDNTNLGTCMDYTNDPSTNQHPNSHDYAELYDIYNHADSYTTSGAATLPAAMPPAMGQIDFDTPAQWGRLVASSRGGRLQTYELDFGGGNKVVTHVFRADPEADAR